MNYDTAIRELEEKREFYSAAIVALRKIAVYETAKTAEPKPAGSSYYLRMTPEQKAKIAAAQRERYARLKAERAATSGNGTQPDSAPLSS